MSETELLQSGGPSGPIQCLACGATLAAPTAAAHGPQCPTAARWRAYEVLGGSPATLARALYREAGDAATARACAAALREVASEICALLGTDAPRGGQ